MKRLFTSLLVFSSNTLLWAQTIERWMYLYDEEGSTELVGGVALYSDTTYRICGSWLSPDGGRITPTAISLSGDTIWRRSYLHPAGQLISGVSRILQTRADLSCLWAGDIYHSGYVEPDAGLFCFSQTGDSLWLRTYGDTSLFESFYGMCLLDDDGVCAVGVSNDGSSSIFIVRTDEAGDTLWTRVVQSSYSQTAYSVVATVDGGFAIGAFRWLNNNNVATVLLKIDALGNEQWLRTYGTPYRDNAGFVSELADGSFVLATAFGIAPVPNTSKRATLIKTDQSGIEQWSATLQDSLYSVFTTVPVLMESGAYVVAGGRLPGGDPIGMLMKLDPVGTPVWERNYVTNAGLSHYIYDLRRTLDGGFIMAGTAFDTVPPLSQDAWLIKTDSFGCLVPGCQVFDAVLEQYTDLTGALTLSPNPTSDLLQVGMVLPPGLVTTGALRLTLVDAQGRKVLEQQVVPSPSLTLSLGSLPSGMYFLHLTCDRKWLAGARVMVD